MKFKFLYSSVVLAFIVFAALSFSAGPTASVGDKTGSPLSNGTTCESCHSTAGIFAPTMSVAVIDDLTSLPVVNNQYIPGQSYTLKFAILAPPTTTIPPQIAQYGMQATAILNSDNTQAGSFSNATTGVTGAGTGAKITSSAAVNYLEHNARSTDGFFNVTWVAPAAGADSVMIYYGGLAINNAAGAGGDNFINGSMLLTEAVGTSITTISSLEYNVYPNPTTAHQFNIQGIDGDAIISVTDLAGRNVLTQTTNLQANTPYAVQLSKDLPLGIYTVSILQENKVGTKKLILL